MASVRPRKRTKGKPSGLFAFPRTAASFAPLTPVAFLPRIAAIHPDRIAVVHGAQRISYRQFEERARRQMMRCAPRSEEHTSELQSRSDLVCRLLLEK